MTPNRPVEMSRILAQADVLLLVREVLVAPLPSAAPMTAAQEAADLRELFAGAGMTSSTRHAEALASQWNAAIADGGGALRQAHCELFEGCTPCPITETAYVRRDKGAILADIAGFYHAFGFEGGELGEKLDHVAVELEYAAVLLIMQAQAWRDGNPSHADIAAEALRAFTRDHLGEWVLLFSRRLAATSALPIHQTYAVLLEDIWEAIAASHGLDPLIQEGFEPTREESHGPYECGMAEQPVELTAHQRPLSTAPVHSKE